MYSIKAPYSSQAPGLSRVDGEELPKIAVGVCGECHHAHPLNKSLNQIQHTDS